jgi:hypothetical protein
MSFKIIENDMIVKNNITLEPHITFVSASNDCEDLVGHNLTSSGISGSIPVTNMTHKYYKDELKGTRVYDIDDSKYNFKVKMESLNSIDVLNEARNGNVFEQELNAKGIFSNRKQEHNFGVEKVKQRYLIDDENYYKKKSIKNLYKYYNENLEHRQFNSHWGFSNYNTINFFNINESLNENIKSNKTHLNCLAYPNLLDSSGKPAYDFASEDLTFSFYINQRRKNKKNHHFNPGCVLSIPKLISIYIVKGTKTDINELTESYRLFIEIGEKTLINTSNNILLSDVSGNTLFDFNNSSLQSQENGHLYLSSDNIINFNCWHNISIVLSKKNDDNYTLLLYNDGELIDTHSITNFNKNANDENNFILIGNKFTNLNGNITKYVNELFSVNGDGTDNFTGPYSTKSISFGSHSVDFIKDYNDSFSIEIKDSLLETIESDYVDENTSCALNAEIHDIRIYNTNMGYLIKDKICKQNIVDYTENKLIFGLPVYYYDNPVEKLGLVNIHRVNSSSQITLSNIHIEGPVNSYFSNKCLGHEVTIENFLYEFKQKISPNIVFGGNLKADDLHSSLNLVYENEDLSQANSTLCKNSSKGISLLETYYQKIKSFDSENGSPNSLSEDNFELIRKHNFYYRNNMILPNDNGLQDQVYDIKGYYTNYSGFSHTTFDNNKDYQHVNLNQVHSDKVLMPNNVDFITTVSNAELVNYSAQSNKLKKEENRRTFFISSGKSFKESYDLFTNASLNNFHKDSFTLNTNSSMAGAIRSLTGSLSNDFIFITKGSNGFLKDLSNPVGRKINDDFRNNAIGNVFPTVSTKIIDNDPTNPDSVAYFTYELPYFNITKDFSETYSNTLCISSSVYNKNIVRESVRIFDTALSGTGNVINISLADNGLGLLHRSDCLTKVADWNYVGHILYKEGFATILHPGLENFSQTNYRIEFKSNAEMNVYELNLPAKATEVNLSRNTSYIENLRLDDSAFNADESFVYITDINLHDEDLNVMATAKLAKPFAKKNTDNVLFRIKMDY